MLESALFRLLEGRHVSESLSTEDSHMYSKFWNQLQMLLKKMLAMALCTGTNRSSSSMAQPNPSNRCGDAGKLRKLYKMSLESTDLGKLHAMHTMWTSS